MNPSHLTSKTQPLAKQFDIMYRKQRPVKNKAKKSSKTSKNCSKQQSKKVLISKNGADSRKVPHFISQYQDLQNSGNELQQYGNILQTKYRNKQKQVLIASKSKSKSKSRSKQRLSLNQKTKRKVVQKSVKTEFMQSPNDITLRNKKDIQGFKQYLNQKQEFEQNESQGLKRHQAALMIQKNFRGYMIRKYLMQYRTVVHSVILIQKHARGFLARRKLKKAAHLKKTLSLQIATKLQVRKEQDQIYEKDSQFKTSRRILQEQSPVRIHEILQKSLSKASQQQIQKWTDILQEILYREQVDQNIKLRILDFLEKHSNKQSPKSNEKSFCDKVLQSQIQSQKRFIQQNKKYFKEKIFSPRSQRSAKSLKSAYQNSFSVNQPVFLMDNLVILQKVHKQKLIDSAQKEKLNLQIMFKKKYFSPRTHQSKRQEIEERLKRQIQKFQSGMEQVLKSCQSNQQVLSRLANTPSRKGQANQPSPRSQLFSPLIRQAQTPSSEDRLKLLGQKDEEDQNNPIIYKNSYSQLALRQQISEKYQEIEQGNGLQHQISSRFSSQTNQNQTIQPFESSFQFIEDYLLSLIEFFRSSQSKSQRRSQFLVKMKQSKNLKVDMVLKNLPLVTQQSEEDTTFKLPLYKYLENQDIQLIQKQIVEDFNRSYTALQRHQLSGRSKNLSQNIQQIYLKMVIDCFNQALNQQRPLMYIFTQQSLKSKSKPRLSELNIQNSPELLLNDESLASFYFATAMNRVYKWASTMCGSFSLTDLPMQIQKQAVYGISQMSQQQNSLHILINQARQRQMVNMQANKPWIFYDQLIQIIVGVSDAVFDEIILEQGAMLFF